ncbi:hypothetical protein BDW66DRAFT_45627 [Aspergillus desertorum]
MIYFTCRSQLGFPVSRKLLLSCEKCLIVTVARSSWIPVLVVTVQRETSHWVIYDLYAGTMAHCEGLCIGLLRPGTCMMVEPPGVGSTERFRLATLQPCFLVLTSPLHGRLRVTMSCPGFRLPQGILARTRFTAVFAQKKPSTTTTAFLYPQRDGNWHWQLGLPCSVQKPAMCFGGRG